MKAAPLLEVDDLKVHFHRRRGPIWAPYRETIRAVDGVGFRIEPGTTFGLVGESGCGKSTTARAILNLVPPTEGVVTLEGQRIDGLREGSMRRYRKDLQMIFQDPYASLDPRRTVGDAIGEPLTIFGLAHGRQKKLEILKLMDLVGLDPRFLNRYPHEFSGGQRQRIGIARALAVRPKLILCDEPVSALDVSIQAQIVNLLKELQRELGLAYLFIAHDLAIVRHISDVIGVMYLGRIVEQGPAEAICSSPKHPYTQALLSAVPIPDPERERSRQRVVLTGDVPSPDQEFGGCPFAARCPIVQPGCRDRVPRLEQIGSGGQAVACFEAKA